MHKSLIIPCYIWRKVILRRRRTIFSQVNKSKKVPVVTLITTYPAMRNAHYMDEIHAEVTMDALFE